MSVGEVYIVIDRVHVLMLLFCLYNHDADISLRTVGVIINGKNLSQVLWTLCLLVVASHWDSVLQRAVAWFLLSCHS